MTNLFVLSLITLTILTACTPGQQFEVDFKERPDIVINPVQPPVVNPPVVQSVK